MSELSELERELVDNYIGKAYSKLIDFFDADLSKHTSLSTSLGFLHMAQSLKPEDEKSLIEIYGLKSLVFAYFEDWEKSLEFQKLAFSLEPDNFYSQTAKTLYLLINPDNNLISQAKITTESFIKKYTHQDGSDLDIFENQMMHQDALFILNIVEGLYEYGIEYLDIVNLALTAPFRKVTITAEDLDTLSNYCSLEELKRDISDTTDFVLAHLHYYLALSE